MFFDFAQIEGAIGYKLMTATVTPRPIAWVVSQDASGRRNAAPFSFFNAVSGDPPVICLGITARAGGRRKDTLANILETGEFVVNLVSEALAAPMNVTAVEFEPEVDETEQAGLELEPSRLVAPPRIRHSPVSLECRLLQSVPLAETKAVVLGRVLALHVADEYVLDAARGYIDTPALHLIARMHGAGWYARSSDLFQMDRLSVAEWQARAGAQES